MIKSETETSVLLTIENEIDFDEAIDTIRDWLGVFPCLTLVPNDNTEGRNGPWTIQCITVEDHELYVGECLFIDSDGNIEVLTQDELEELIDSVLEDEECECEDEWACEVQSAYDNGVADGYRKAMKQLEFNFHE